MKTRVVVVDDHASIRQMLAISLLLLPSAIICSTARSRSVSRTRVVTNRDSSMSLVANGVK